MTSPVSGTALRRALALTAAVALGSTLAAAPASAALESTTAAAGGAQSSPAVPSPASPVSPAAAGVQGEGLAEAVQRDLGMTLEEFNAAGEQGKRAAAEPAASEPGAAPTKPAATPDAPEDRRAVSVEQLYQAYLREVGPTGLQAVAEADGRFIIRTGGINEPQAEPQPAAGADSTGPNSTGPDSTEPENSEADGAGPTESRAPASADPALVEQAGGGRLSPSEFVGQYANVVLESGEPLAPEEDFFGGQGYRIDGGVVCSAGFSAFSPDGEPLVLTAGHCADDGAARLVEVTLPAGDPAGGFLADNAVTGKLGTFGFSQFGGPGNSWVADPENPGTPGNDIAVIESIRADLEPLPATATWADPTRLGTGSVKIVGMASPFVGQDVCRSGRTAGWSCGTVDEVGIYVVGGGSGDPADLRSFSGFLSTSVESSGGDSGGPWISGNYAVGTHSAGNSADSVENFAVAATLQHSMSVLPGVQLRLFLNKPVLAGTLPAGPIAAGQRVAGRLASAPATDVPAGTRVRIAFPGSEPFDVDVDAQGNWAFRAPVAADGFTAQAVNGFSRSELSTFSTAPKPAVPEPPVDGGSGTPGAGTPGSGTPGAGGSPVASPPASPRAAVKGGEPAVLAPAPQPTVVAVHPAAGSVPPAGPDGDASSMALADTGASGLTLAAAGAGVALLLGGVMLALVRRRRRR
ncbi:S1 family peptidase [Arthrobacter globiformis]|uniref:S1 family peptidase n=1 Tax=Arthrobacter globiformis TaxID=1665 RepID=UPI000B41C8E5|nr:S1 family peptidase [Arthrobacter globiformis]